jgi:hypothetical protein
MHTKGVPSEVQKFREIFMPRACEKYKYLKRSTGIDTLEFLLEDIRRPFNHYHPEKGGFNIVRWPDQYIENILLPLLIDERLIERISPRRYRLREDGKRYCRRLDPSI